MRLDRGIFIYLWVIGLVVQGALAMKLLPINMLLAFGAVVAMQLLKLPIVAARLRDLGAPPDDAVMTLVPFANIGLLLNKLLKPTPSSERWDSRVARWSSQPTALSLVRGAMAKYRKVLPLSLPLVGLFVGINTFGFIQSTTALSRLQKMPVEELEMIRQGSVGLTGVLVIYTMLQIAKRRSATRQSWVPSLLLLPVGFVALLVSMGTALGPVALMLQSTAWDLVWEIFGGSLLSLFWVCWAFDIHEGKTPSYASALSRMKGRWLGVAAAYGGVTISVWAGLQVVIPGIYYAISYAMVDICVLDDPKSPAFARSTQMVRGIRRRVFKVFAIVLLVGISAQFISIVSIDGVAVLGQALSDPGAISWRASVPGDLVCVALWGVIKFAFVDLYLDRKARLADG
jgi:hypothetical protein